MVSQQPADGLKAFEVLVLCQSQSNYSVLQLGCSAHAHHVMHLEKEQKEKGAA